MTGCRHEFDLKKTYPQDGMNRTDCLKCGMRFSVGGARVHIAAINMAAADLAARDAEIEGLHRKIRGLVSMIPPLTPEEAQREWDSFDGPVEPMTDEEIGRIVDEVMNRVARSKGKVQE